MLVAPTDSRGVLLVDKLGGCASNVAEKWWWDGGSGA